MKIIFLFVFMSLLAITHAGAEDHRPFTEMKGDCKNYAMDLSREFTAWDSINQSGVSAGSKYTGNDTPEIPLNSKVTLGLLAAKDFIPAAPLPEEKQKMYKGKYAGYAKFRTPKSGNYRLSAGAKAWIELLADRKKPVDAYSFEMQTSCEKIFKVISFHLKKGKTYYLQISGSERGNLPLLVTPSK